MINTEDNNDILIGTTCRNDDDKTTSLTIPKEFARKLEIENTKVSMSLVNDCEGNRHLLVSKFHREIVID